MSKPKFENGLMCVYAEPDTWCNPMHVVAMFAELAEMAWKQRNKAHDGKRRFKARQAETCLHYFKRAANMSPQDVKGIDRLLAALKKDDADIEIGDQHVYSTRGFKSRQTFMAARREDSALDLYAIKATLRETLGLVKPYVPVSDRYAPSAPRPRLRSICQLGYFDLWTWEELELRWRVRDASWASKSQVRGRERIAAFEAL